jgi:hypothetical protein
MNISKLIPVIAIILIYTISSCRHTAKYPSSAINTNYPNKLNTISFLLAGIKPTGNSEIADSLQKLPVYLQYCDSMNLGFDSIEVTRLSKMRSWAKTELQVHPKTIFYPFSGPDILHCVQFFPDADEYIMIGLERYGYLPSFDITDSAKITTTLNATYRSLGDMFSKSYFITRKMLTDVSNANNGVVPIACISLVRAGYTILDIKSKHLVDNDGNFKEIPADSLDTNLNDCIEIYFRKTSDAKLQKLIYFRNNLADCPYDVPDYFILNSAYSPNNIPGLKVNENFKVYLDHLPECYGYIKSASYLLFQEQFSLIRNICLRKCKYVLQDDTGIPYDVYIQKNWKATLYGRYERSISIFHGGYFQAGLDSIYKADSLTIPKLPFSLGYHYEDQMQNLMKFEKKPSPYFSF